jgi:hypothetical protein
MAANTNYTGRTVDLSMFLGAQASGETAIQLDFAGGGSVITGIEKLIQSFLMLFLTEQGTVQYFPSIGSGFVTALRLGQLRTEVQVQQQFDLAVEEVGQTMALAADTAKLPSDETFASATLLSFNLDTADSKLVMQIQIASLAGVSRQIYLPVPIAIQ